MRDRFGREIDYLRISVTDRCNLRCRYCMPDGVRHKVSHDEILRSEEFVRIAATAARLGIRHIRITGGEPLTRLGCPELVGALKKIPGIQTVTMTTNGTLLHENLDALENAGIDGINISLDTTEPEVFREITGSDQAGRVLQAVRETAARGIPVKINAVTMQDTDVSGLTAIAAEMPVDVRFIEMMPIGYGRLYPDSDNRRLIRKLAECHPDLVPESAEAERLLRESLEGAETDRFFLNRRNPSENITLSGKAEFAPDRFRTEDARTAGEGTQAEPAPAARHGQGPAVYFRIPGYQGSIGFISAVHEKFCSSCNRVRLTSAGYLKTCLCYSDGADLRSVLRGGSSRNSGAGADSITDTAAGTDPDRGLDAVMRRAIYEKPRAHCFDQVSEITEIHEMSQIGG